jgi:hypothetical protein
MVFESATEFTPNYFARWISTGGNWEIGFSQMMFGVRVRFGKKDWGCCELDYCAGDSREFQQELMRTVRTILLGVPETVTPREIGDMFPHYTIKPIINDPVCWPTLQRMAAETLQKLAHETSNEHRVA